ncbi:MAG: dihydroorotase [Flavobacteriaceae bacterium]
MKKLLIQQATVVNEGETFVGDVLIEGEKITQIATTIPMDEDMSVLDATGLHLIPGLIDDQVHFREPGLTHKADIESESKAAVAGGITSYLEMPNTQPQTTSAAAFQAKLDRAAETSWANYNFLFGGTNDNLEEIKNIDIHKVAGLKLFLGSSTGNMLVDDEAVLEAVFKSTPLRIAAHCEDEQTIRTNLANHKEIYGDDIPIDKHPVIRSEEACYRSSSKAVALAQKTGARLHVFHLSTAKELSLFTNDLPLKDKKITAEVCVHHLWFSDEDYSEKGTLIKWNPAVKKATDRAALWEALNDDRIDVIATDHAPHTWDEKQQNYTHAPSGGPLVQHALLALLHSVKQGKITLEKLIQKACHNPAILFDIADRGFIRPGYYADLVLVNLNETYTVKEDNILAKCGWSPFLGQTFDARVEHTIVNGHIAYSQGELLKRPEVKQLTFDR